MLSNDVESFIFPTFVGAGVIGFSMHVATSSSIYAIYLGSFLFLVKLVWSGLEKLMIGQWSGQCV